MNLDIEVLHGFLNVLRKRYGERLTGIGCEKMVKLFDEAAEEYQKLPVVEKKKKRRRL